MITRKTLTIALLLSLVGLAWNTVKAQEVITLHVLGPGTTNHYAQLWVVEAKPYLWIRADQPSRKWLEGVRANPDVFVWRGGQRQEYRATIREDRETREYVDGLFREKYGYMDKLREPLRAKHTIPIQLDPR
jgi:hypothetical protein